MDSGWESGVPTKTMFYVPTENRAKFWYSTDYGMFHFFIADSEHDWREESEQYEFIEKCLAFAVRKNQPWLIFAAHRVLGYSSDYWYVQEGSFDEPMGRDSLQKLWQKYKVDIAFYGHVHNYERSCPIYQNRCVNSEKKHYSGTTIHVVVGSKFSPVVPNWSIYRDFDFGFVKLTAFNHVLLYSLSTRKAVMERCVIPSPFQGITGMFWPACTMAAPQLLQQLELHIYCIVNLSFIRFIRTI